MHLSFDLATLVLGLCPIKTSAQQWNDLCIISFPIWCYFSLFSHLPSVCCVSKMIHLLNVYFPFPFWNQKEGLGPWGSSSYCDVSLLSKGFTSIEGSRVVTGIVLFTPLKDQSRKRKWDRDVQRDKEKGRGTLRKQVEGHVGSIQGEGTSVGYILLLVLKPRIVTCLKLTIVGDSSHCSQLQRMFLP